MKRIIIYSVTLLLGASMWACSEDKLDPNSIFVDPTAVNTPYDNYLYREFVVPYNVDVKYKMSDMETELQYNVVPARIECAKAMSVLLKHLWLDVYGEASPIGVDFMKQYNVRVIHFVGSGQFTSNGTVLGTAEGGKKMTLTDVNAINPADASTLSPVRLMSHYGKFQVIHHEFAHILNQTKDYQTSFQQISGGYIGTDWRNVDQPYINEQYPEAHAAGFVSPYAMGDANEDFVETYSIYITKSVDGWERFLSDATPEGRALIDRKVTAIKEYMKNSWNMNLDEIRAIMQRRAVEIGQLEFTDLK